MAAAWNAIRLRHEPRKSSGTSISWNARFTRRRSWSVARSSLRNRKRQFETRTHLEALVKAKFTLSQMNETLEQRVASQIVQRERAEEQLRQAQKMEMLGQLTGGVAHDFNNLLMVVLVNLELIGRMLPDNPTARQLIDAAVQSTKRGASLTQRLLAFSRRQELVIESHDLSQLVDDMRDLLQRSLGSTYQLQLTLPAGLPRPRSTPIRSSSPY